MLQARPLTTFPSSLSFKCDGCLYNEFCMKWSAEHDDLCLLPYISGTEKDALRRSGVTTIKTLATLKDFAPDKSNDLIAAPGQEALVRQIAGTWPVGPRLDELIHRAKSFQRSVRKDGSQALSYIPGKGNSSLPVSTPELNPNLVRIYLDAQHDYLEGRSLHARCLGGRLQGWRAGRQKKRGEAHGRPARHGSQGKAAVRDLDS